MAKRATHPTETRIRQLEKRLREPISDSEWVNISGIIRMLKDGAWGRKEPFGEDTVKLVLLVGGQPIAAVDSQDEVIEETRATPLAN